MKKTLFAKLVSLLLITLLVVGPHGATLALAQEVPASPIPASSPIPEVSPQTQGQQSPASPMPAASPIPEATPFVPTNPQNPSNPDEQTAQSTTATASPIPASSPSSTENSTQDTNSTGTTESNSKTTGTDNSINTGDAGSDALLINQANNNVSGFDGNADSGDISVTIDENGAHSNNSADIDTTNDSDTLQNNDADVDNDVDMESLTGDNEANYNTGGDNEIESGDANVTAAVVNGINSNVSGVDVIEFNIEDNHTGDILLAFPTGSGCNAGLCGTNGNLTVNTQDNGAYSDNSTDIDTTNNQNTFQNNSADVVNDLYLTADTGNNETNFNTGGNNSITTGDANIAATVANFVNNNIAGAGNVLLSVVNIFGDLVGNILMPDLAGWGGVTADTSGNGAFSNNNTDVNTTNNSNTTQTNLADIENNIDVAATTGNNDMNENTAGFGNGGNVLSTGDATVDVNAVNIANTNLLAGDVWWLVFVNDADGNWRGQIMGAPQGSHMAGSSGTEFVVGADGSILAQNVGNGAHSENSTDISTANNNNTTQNNDAKIVNNLRLDANTGNNESSYNTGGSNSITTGDANVMANVLNFVNNNFVGGRVVLSVVNVFGSWLGNFVPHGEQAPEIQSTGGSDTSNHQSDNSNNSSNSQNSTGGSNQISTTNGIATAQVTNVSGTNSLPGAVAGLFWGGTGGAEESETDEPTGNNGASTVVDDDTISVPDVKTAGAKTHVPSWFWNILSIGVALIVVKRLVKLAVKKPKALN